MPMTNNRIVTDIVRLDEAVQLINKLVEPMVAENERLQAELTALKTKIEKGLVVYGDSSGAITKWAEAHHALLQNASCRARIIDIEEIK